MNGDPPPQTNKSIITWVVVTLAANATIGILTLSYVLISGRTLDPVIFTAFVAIVNYILGVLSGMLAKTSPTEATKASLPSSGSPTEVKVMSTPKDPVHVEEGKESLVT